METIPAFDLEALARSNPEQAAIYIDGAIKKQVLDSRENWVVTARMVAWVYKTEIWRHHPENFKSIFEWGQQAELDIAGSIMSDMIAFAEHETDLAKAGVNIWSLIVQAGPSKVRQMVPQIRESAKTGTIAKDIGTLIDALPSMSFREVLAMKAVSGVRQDIDWPASWVQTSDGVEVTIKLHDVAEIPSLAKKTGIKRWFDHNGLRFDLNDLK